MFLYIVFAYAGSADTWYCAYAGSVIGSCTLCLLTQAALTLSDEAERSRPFASPMGQLMLTQRTSQAVAKQVNTHVSILQCLTPHCPSLLRIVPHACGRFRTGNFATTAHIGFLRSFPRGGAC